MQEAFKNIVIEDVYPDLDCGRYPVKREVGDRLEVWADIFKEGHDVISAVVKHREEDDDDSWSETPMRLFGNDRWTAAFDLTKNTRYEYAIEAWTDSFETWRREIGKKVEAGQDVSMELTEGRAIVEDAYGRSKDKRLAQILKTFDGADYEGRLALLRSEEVADLVASHPDRSHSSVTGTLLVTVDRERARYGAWYEMFHRSQGIVPGESATFADMEERLPELSDLGFDVVYLVPIHPIGTTNRKGKNNAITAAPGDPGSPYGIGSAEGGHMAVHPDLGTLEDFRRFVERTHEHGMEVALDFAIQASPDHPYIDEHPEWFRFRPDGSIKYAENPPKKYQDIVNVDWGSEDWDGLWREWRDVLLFWVEQGVKIFRVDNPHTKPFAFWEWVIREVQRDHPDVIFLSEAFTRPKVMKNLAKLGFSQSYTYFTWRNEKQEIIEYLTELTKDWPKEYMRPNFFANTHDILPHILQFGGRPAFIMRLVLAATLSPTYGIYNGYELCENTPRGERGTTVYYQDSEVYEYKVWDWDRPGNIKDYVKRINGIRRENPALQELTNLEFYEAPNDDILFYGKKTGNNAVFVAANLDPHGTHDTHVRFPLWELGIAEDEPYVVEELLSGRRMQAVGSYFWVRLAPGENPVEVFRLSKVESAEDRADAR